VLSRADSAIAIVHMGSGNWIALRGPISLFGMLGTDVCWAESFDCQIGY